VFTNVSHSESGGAHRDLTALQSLYGAAPGLVPKPLSSGVLTMGDGSKRATLAMQHLPGESLAARPSLRTPELSALRPYAARMGAALRATDTIWDKTPPNVMRSGGQYRFIDVKRNASFLAGQRV
jgi:hypothetical protein